MEQQTYFHSVRLNKEICHGCINCVKRCPTEAIRVRDGKARILKERCIDCGECIRICPHHAKIAISDSFEDLAGFEYKIALPAPVLYAQFVHLDCLERVVKGLLDIGFDEVFEVGAAAELISESTRKLMESNLIPLPVISSACPAAIRLIRVRFPDLLQHILPLQPPVELAARMARKQAAERLGISPEKIGIAFISPCPAKVTAAKAPLGNEKSSIDAVIAISRIYPDIVKAIKNLSPDDFKNLSHVGSSGLFWATCSGESTASDMRRYIAVDGVENIIRILEAVENDQYQRLDFIELSACPGGCVGGVMNVENPYAATARIKRLARTLPPVCNHWPMTALPDTVRLTKVIEPLDVMALDPNPTRAMEMLAKMQELEKTFPGLDCGSCGSPTCHALAEDIVRGYSNEDACIYVLKAKLEKVAASLSSFISPQVKSWDKEENKE